MLIPFFFVVKFIEKLLQGVQLPPKFNQLLEGCSKSKLKAHAQHFMHFRKVLACAILGAVQCSQIWLILAKCSQIFYYYQKKCGKRYIKFVRAKLPLECRICTRYNL